MSFLWERWIIIVKSIHWTLIFPASAQTNREHYIFIYNAFCQWFMTINHTVCLQLPSDSCFFCWPRQFSLIVTNTSFCWKHWLFMAIPAVSLFWLRVPAFIIYSHSHWCILSLLTDMQVPTILGLLHMLKKYLQNDLCSNFQVSRLSYVQTRGSCSQ